MLPALVAFGLILGLALTEVAYRIARSRICVGRDPSSLFVPHEDIGWTHRKNAVGWVYGCDGREYEFRNRVRTNSNGLRDREISYEKSPRTRRILVLGDSMTEALQVPLEDTFVKWLERELVEAGNGVEVINGGSAAYGTDNELLFYRHEGRRYEPDVVVLVLFTRNDVIEVSKTLHARFAIASKLFPKRYFDLDADGRLVRDVATGEASTDAGESPSVRLWGYARSNLFAVRALERILLSQRASTSEGGSSQALVTWRAVYAREPDEELAHAWRLLERLVAALRDDVRESGARFLVAILPAREEVQMALPKDARPLIASFPGRFDMDQANRLARAMLDRIGVEYLDLLPPLRLHARESGESGYYDVDIHLTPRGHAIVASELAERLAPVLDELAESADPVD